MSFIEECKREELAFIAPLDFQMCHPAHLRDTRSAPCLTVDVQGLGA